MTARVRTVELAVLTTQVRERRAALAAHRAEMRRALWEADVRARAFRPTAGHTLECARQLAGLTPTELWLRYIGMGGYLGPEALAAVLHGDDEPDDRDYDILSAVLNEEFRLRGLGDPVPVRRRPPSIAGG